MHFMPHPQSNFPNREYLRKRLFHKANLKQLLAGVILSTYVPDKIMFTSFMLFNLASFGTGIWVLIEGGIGRWCLVGLLAGGAVLRWLIIQINQP